MDILEKISLEWKLVTDPELRETATAEILEYIDFLITQFDKTQKENLSDASDQLGYDFNRIYAFPIGKVNTAIYDDIERILENRLDAVLTDNMYEENLENTIRTTLITRFGDISHAQTFDENHRPDFLITTYKALKSANFSFNEDKTAATPPPRIISPP